MKALIAYFSRAHENYVSGTLKELEVGNTEAAAGIIRKLTGADIFRIDPVRAYAADYNTCIEEARADRRRNARPALKEYPESLDGYDVIYLGYPNYWGTMPMAVFTFLEHFDFKGKAIRPFCTHEGSGMGASEKDIARLCAGAKVEKGLPIHGGSVASAEPLIRSWIESLSK